MTLRHSLLVAIAGAATVLPRAADAVDPRDYRTERISSNSTYNAPRVDGTTLGVPNYGYNVDPTYGYDPFQDVTPTPQGGPFSPVLPTENTTPAPTPMPGRGRETATNGAQIQYVQPGVAQGTATDTAQKNRWRIGIRSQDSESGVRVMRVLAGSPAKTAGLEAEDKIVAVGGYQVGIVNGQRFDLGNEFDLRCDENGSTFLLVQNHRDGQLVTLPVQLEPRFSAVTGELVWRSQRSLPREAYAVVELREIVRPGARPITIAEKTIYGLKQTTQTGRVPFEVEYDPAEIQPGRQYVIYSQITNGYNTLYHTEQPYAVITQQNPRRVNVTMAQIYDWTGGQQAYIDDSSREWQTFVTLFQKYMGRPMRTEEASIYRGEFERGKDLNNVMVDVVSAPEFYHRCNTDDRNFVIKAYQMRHGKMPTEQDIQYWLTKLREAENQHRPFARELLTQLN